MNPSAPTVSLGLPVYNGEEFLAQAIESCLNQTYEDFELVISDNASTDATKDICKKYVGLDNRVRYTRTSQNIGASENFNRVFRQSQSPYFKWVAHDDLMTADYLQRCVEVLQEESSVALVHSRVRFIDETGNDVERKSPHAETASSLYPAASTKQWSPNPVQRFESFLFEPASCYQIFGLMRRSALEKTTLHRPFYGADRLLVAQMSLLGRLYQLPDALFFRRCHSNQSTSLPTPRERTEWITGRAAGPFVFPQWHLFKGYVAAVLSADLSATERLRGLGTVLKAGARPEKLRRLVVPGPHNYFGIGAG